MGTLKKYRFRLAWQNYRRGDVIEPTGVVRGWLLTNGYIEPVAEAISRPARPEPAGGSAATVTEPPAEPPAPTRQRKRAYLP